MHRSIVGRYAARPVPRFATVAPRAREPRLGLDRHVRFRAAADRPTLLRRPDVGPVALLRGDWRAAGRPMAHRSAAGLHGSVRWAKFGAHTTGRRPRAATAPWRG